MKIADTVRAYLRQHPGEADRLHRLTAALADGSAPTSRAEFRGHVTCSAAIFDPQGRVLHIRHVALRRWLLPGGHLEPQDRTLLDAALREAREETGLTALHPLGDAPVDIDVHPIPANPAKPEPEHWHFDFRYAFELRDEQPIALQAEEVSAYDWLGLDAMRPEPLTTKLAVMSRRS